MESSAYCQVCYCINNLNSISPSIEEYTEFIKTQSLSYETVLGARCNHRKKMQYAVHRHTIEP